MIVKNDNGEILKLNGEGYRIQKDIVEIIDFENVKWVHLGDCREDLILPEELGKNMTDLSFMFYGSEFNGDISRWDTSNVTTMEDMFGHSEFNGDISNWNVSNVENMAYMFEYSKFNGDISKWNISPRANTALMFGTEETFKVEQEERKTTNTNQHDNVNSPIHYQLGELGIETKDVIKVLLSKEQYLGWCWGNALKYMFRWDKKNKVEDLNKAIVYINWMKGEIEDETKTC